jgi:hypothetical protein
MHIPTAGVCDTSMHRWCRWGGDLAVRPAAGDEVVEHGCGQRQLQQRSRLANRVAPRGTACGQSERVQRGADLGPRSDQPD